MKYELVEQEQYRTQTPKDIVINGKKWGEVRPYPSAETFEKWYACLTITQARFGLYGQGFGPTIECAIVDAIINAHEKREAVHHGVETLLKAFDASNIPNEQLKSDAEASKLHFP
jgi:hypothetical protein